MTNGILDLFCAFASLLVMGIFVANRRRLRTWIEKLIILTMSSVFVMLLTDGVSTLLRDQYSALQGILTTLSIVASFVVVGLYVGYVLELVKPKAAIRKAVDVIAFGGSGVASALYLFNSARPFFYDVHEHVYFNNTFYYATQAVFLLLILAIITLLLVNGKNNISMTERIYLTAAGMFPLISVIFEALVPGLRLRHAFIFLATLIVFIRSPFSVDRYTKRRVDEAEKLKVSNTLERIKPHYIYNVLTSIYYLCDTDVEVAKEAIEVFSDYLRDALNVMEENTLIPFSREMRTVRNYLDLERMRFGDKVRVRYRVGADSFMLPPFTVQPLVENSVKHGLANASGGGEIIIASYESEDCYAVSVSDTYEGFDQERSKGEGSAVKYIRDILKLTVDGTLMIRSEPGKGTVSLITIPKKSEKTQKK